jgi:hypothetical protein
LADKKQMVVVTDHDSKVLARKTFRCRAWDLGAALDWAGKQAAAKGFAGVTVACEPTGHRWRVLGQLAADRSMSFVCVQPMLTSWARRSEDLTFDKTDEKDAVIIARLTVQLRCYVPEPVDETWGRLRHLGARREQLLDDDPGRPGRTYPYTCSAEPGDGATIRTRSKTSPTPPERSGLPMASSRFRRAWYGRLI